jgi:iron complex transport system ATP-binding protein
LTDPAPISFAAEHVSFAFVRGADFLTDVSLAARFGECWGIVGPNGAGKSTLIRLLAGIARPSRGRILLRNRSLASFSATQRAQQIAYLPQRLAVPNDLTAGEVVLMGRYPHRSMGLFESAHDMGRVRDAMSLTETDVYLNRPMGSLSGGEAQRVHLAAALAQEPSVLLLDEPTTALDWKHQLAIFSVLRRLADRGDMIVVVVTHDLNLAARFCDAALLMNNGRVVGRGPVRDILTPGALAPVFGVRVETLWAANGTTPVLTPTLPEVNS